jgi:predicted Zn finger-like uncharacterized protein
VSLRATCPGCQTVLAVPEQAAGKAVGCPKCRTVFPALAVEEPKPLESIAAAIASPPVLPQPREGKLTWKVPADFAEKQVDVIVGIQDADKQERFHTFTLIVDDNK